MYYFWLLLGTIPFAITTPIEFAEDSIIPNSQDETGNGQGYSTTPPINEVIGQAAFARKGVEYAARDLFVQSNIDSCPEYFDYAAIPAIIGTNAKFEVQCSTKWSELIEQSDGLKDEWGTVVGGTKFDQKEPDCAEDENLYCCDRAPFADDLKKDAKFQRHNCIKVAKMSSYSLPL